MGKLGKEASCGEPRPSATTSTGWITVPSALSGVMYCSGHNLGSDLCICLSPKHLYSSVPQAP